MGGKNNTARTVGEDRKHTLDGEEEGEYLGWDGHGIFRPSSCYWILVISEPKGEESACLLQALGNCLKNAHIWSIYHLVPGVLKEPHSFAFLGNQVDQKGMRL